MQMENLKRLSISGSDVSNRNWIYCKLHENLLVHEGDAKKHAYLLLQLNQINKPLRPTLYKAKAKFK